MARNNAIINSFVTGEASPKFRGRTDTSQYAQSCEETLNMLIYPQGGAGRRPGTQLMGQILSNNSLYPAAARIFPFSAADGTRWQLLITDLIPDTLDSGNSRYTWYAVNVSTLANTRIQYSGTVVAKAYYDFKAALTPEGAIDMNEVQYAQSGDTMFFVHPRLRPFKIVYGSGGTFTMSPFADVYSATAQVTYAEMPYQELVQGTVDTIKVTGSTSPVAGTTYLVQPGAGSGISFTAASVGQHLKLSAGGITLALIITVYTNPLNVTAVYNGGDLAASPTTFGSAGGTSYELGYWDEHRGWPRTVTFFESRLVFGGSKTFPDTMWFSQISNILNFTTRRFEQDPDFALAVAATDPFDLNLKAEVLNQIRWMSPGKTITAGTNQREFAVQGPNPQESIGPENLQSQAETNQGSAYVQAVRVQNTTVFLERDRRKLRELVYNLDENSFQATDLNIIAEHIANKSALKFSDPNFSNREGFFVQMAFQSVPDGILWCIDNNGALCGLTRERQQQVLAWHYHEIAGVSAESPSSAGQYSPKVTAISVIQTPEGALNKREPDELWMLVKRSVNVSGTYSLRFFLERLAREWTLPTIHEGWGTFNMLAGDTAAPIYMDCTMLLQAALPLDPGSFNQTGLIPAVPHGAGQTLSLIIEGFYLGEVTVASDGSLDIAELAAPWLGTDFKAMIGFNYNADIVPAVQEVPAPTGSSMGQPRRVDQLVAHFNRTIAAQYGVMEPVGEEQTPEYNMEDFQFGVPSENGDVPIQMFTGDKKVVFAKGYNDRQRVRIRSSIPLPMQITHLVLKQVIYE